MMKNPIFDLENGGGGGGVDLYTSSTYTRVNTVSVSFEDGRLHVIGNRCNVSAWTCGELYTLTCCELG